MGTYRLLNSMQLFSYVVVFLLSSLPQRIHAALRSYNLTLHPGTRAPDGVSREVYLINDQQPGPLIEAVEGDDLDIYVQNNLPVEQTIHWHGLLQRGTPGMDGVPGVTQFPIPPQGNFTYRFSTGSEYGIYWYHSHFRAYYNDAVRGPLLIHPSPSRRRPFESLARDSTELEVMLQAERAATPLLLTDWYHRLSDVIYDEYFTTGAFPQCVDSLLADGYNVIIVHFDGLNVDGYVHEHAQTIRSCNNHSSRLYSLWWFEHVAGHEHLHVIDGHCIRHSRHVQSWS